MIALARLLNGARGDRWRLAAIAGGVALGVALALSLWSGFTAIADRGVRSSWIDVNRQGQNRVELDDRTALTADQLLARTNSDRFLSHEITVLQVATTPDTTTTLPGIGRPPAPGTSVVSPALAALIASHPPDELGTRYGTIVAELPDAVPAGPNALVAVIGVEPVELANDGMVFTALVGSAFATENYGYLAVIGAIAVGFPVAILLAVVTSLGSAKREEQLATLRLIGATPAALTRLAAWETAATSMAGAVAGVAMAWLVAPALAGIELEGVRFFADDLRPGIADSLVIGLGVVVIAVGIAALRARRLRGGPLGAVRERIESLPSGWRVLPLALGLIGLLTLGLAGLAVAKGAPRAVPPGPLVIGCFVLVTFGLITAGPPLLGRLAGLGSRRADGAVAVIALNRIRRHPRQSFRAVSGLVIACFVVSVFAGARTTLGNLDLQDGPDHLPPQTLIATLDWSAYETPGLDSPTLRRQLDALRAVPGVTAVAAVGHSAGGIAYLTGSDATALGFPSSEPLVGVDAGYRSAPFLPRAVEPPVEPIWVRELLVQTTDAAARERVRTVLVTGELGLRVYNTPPTRAEWSETAFGNTWANEYAVLANLGILVAAGISALAMAAATLAGVLDRRRVFGLLRLTGMPPRTLGRIIATEAAVPLLTVFVMVAALGQFVAWAMVTGLTDGRRTTGWPGPDYYLVLAACLALAAVAVAVTAHSARRGTSTAVTRFE
ncbi:MAG: FtsX-like permease family protein [Actinobacteria bacterium]|nr:FtsX-like permease family protein [Actinomycetota bacterium]